MKKFKQVQQSVRLGLTNKKMEKWKIKNKSEFYFNKIIL